MKPYLTPAKVREFTGYLAKRTPQIRKTGRYTAGDIRVALVLMHDVALAKGDEPTALRLECEIVKARIAEQAEKRATSTLRKQVPPSSERSPAAREHGEHGEPDPSKLPKRRGVEHLDTAAIFLEADELDALAARGGVDLDVAAIRERSATLRRQGAFQAAMSRRRA